MKSTFTIIGTAVEAHSTAKAAKKAIAAATTEPAILVTSPEGLAGAEISGKELVAIWNALPGVTPVKKFSNRKVAVERIWKVIETPDAEAVAHGAPAKKNAAKPRSKAGKASQRVTDPKESKKSAVIALLRRANGVTLNELMAATGWQAHSIRGFLSGTVRKRMGLEPERFKLKSGEYAYRLKS